MRLSVTVGSRGVRIVRLPEAARGTGRRWVGRRGGGAAAGIGAVGGAGLDRSSDVAGAGAGTDRSSEEVAAGARPRADRSRGALVPGSRARRVHPAVAGGGARPGGGG